MTTVLLFLISFNILSKHQRFLVHPQRQLVTQLNNWPTIPSSYFNLAQTAFDLGNLLVAKQQLYQAQRLVDWYDQVGLGYLFRNKQDAISTQISLPDYKQQQLASIDQQLEKHPYSWQLLAHKAKLLKELYHDEKSYTVLKQVTWINPEVDTTPLQ